MAPQPKSYTRTVTTDEERLQILAVAAKRDWSFYILHQEFDGKKFSTVARGASTRYPDFDTARAAVDAAVHKAVKVGWPTKELSRGPRNLARNVREIKIYDPKKGRKTQRELSNAPDNQLQQTSARRLEAARSLLKWALARRRFLGTSL